SSGFTPTPLSPFMTFFFPVTSASRESVGDRSADHLRRYMVTVAVSLHIPFVVAGDTDARPVVGYYRQFGVSAESETAAIELLTAVISDREIDWLDSRVAIATPETLDPVIVDRSK